MALRSTTERALVELLQNKQESFATPRPERVRTAQEQAEHEASEAFAEGLRASGESIRGFARRVGKDESLIRAYTHGAKVVPLSILKRLNAAGQFAALRKCIATVPKEAVTEAADDGEGDFEEERRTG